ncbi:golgin subfamily A member 6-like protein 22 [Palaemon carinicauda]|uniref:golgin subfamily A member 6-like protein 22 n=1 Tax=Palaemon carinicauda TaxID=392227 RepID=UPI0035B6A62A
MEPKRVSLIKVKKNGYPGPGTVMDLVEKFEKTGKMAKQKRNVSLGNEGQVRTRIMQYEERIKGEGKRKKDSVGIRRNPAREAKEVALARIVEIHKFEMSENGYEERIKDEGKQKDSLVIRRNPTREAKKVALARIVEIHKFEMSYQAARVALIIRQFENMLRETMTENSPGTEADSGSFCGDYGETMMGKILARKQTTYLRREAKDRALLRIRRIAMDEVSPDKRGLVYDLVQLWEEALKGEKIDKKKKIVIEVIEEGIVKRNIQYLENIIRGNIQEDDLRGQSRDFRNHLGRVAKDIASAQIRKIVEEEMASEKRGIVYDLIKRYETALKGDKIEAKNEYQEARKSQTLENFIEYFENRLQEKTETEGDLLGQSPDFRETLNRKAKDIALARISQIIQEELSEEQNEKLWKSENIDEKTEIEGDLLGQSPDFRENLNRKAKDIALARISQIIQEWLSEEQNEKSYQESNSPGTKADSASKGGEYAEIMMMNGMMKRKHLRREAKDVALIRTRQIAQEEISQQKGYKVYALIKLWEEALKHEKTDKRQKVNLEEIEEGIVGRGIQYFENIIRGIIVSDCCQAIEWGLQGVGAHEELSEQNENVWKSENFEKELQDYQEANSSGTQGYSASNSDDYEEIIKLKVMGRKQTADLRRKAKDRAFFKIRRIAMEEVFPEERRLVYGLVQVWEEALKGEKIEKMKKVIHEVIEKGNVKRHIQKFENAIRGNLKEGDLGGQPRDFRNHLRRTTKDKALAQIRKLVQEEMSEKTGRVYDLTELHENAIKGDKIEKKSEYKAIKSQTLENLIEYFENMLQENSENEGNLHGQSRDLGSHLRRAAKDVALARIRNILQEAIEEENFEE